MQRLPEYREVHRRPSAAGLSTRPPWPSAGNHLLRRRDGRPATEWCYHRPGWTTTTPPPCRRQRPSRRSSRLVIPEDDGGQRSSSASSRSSRRTRSPSPRTRHRAADLSATPSSYRRARTVGAPAHVTPPPATITSCHNYSKTYNLKLLAAAIKLKTLQQNGRRHVPVAPPILLQSFYRATLRVARS